MNFSGRRKGSGDLFRGWGIEQVGTGPRICGDTGVEGREVLAVVSH